MIWQTSIWVFFTFIKLGLCQILCENDLKPPKWTSLEELAQSDESRIPMMMSDLDAGEEKVFNQEVFIDAWGFQLNWTKEEEGWYPERKESFFVEARTGRLKSQGLKKFTTKGYKLMDIPTSLFRVILEQRQVEQMYQEDCQKFWHIMNCKTIINNQTIFANNSFLIPVMNEEVVVNIINAKLRPILQKWAKIDLADQIVVYGIRRYLRGAQLLLHNDKLPTHIISAILQIDQKVDENWPINLVDHKGQKKSLTLKPGKMLLYESATVPHGRQFPLKGDFYDNIFIHFAPVKRNLIFIQ